MSAMVNEPMVAVFGGENDGESWTPLYDYRGVDIAAPCVIVGSGGMDPFGDCETHGGITYEGKCRYVVESRSEMERG